MVEGEVPSQAEPAVPLVHVGGAASHTQSLHGRGLEHGDLVLLAHQAEVGDVLGELHDLVHGVVDLVEEVVDEVGVGDGHVTAEAALGEAEEDVLVGDGQVGQHQPLLPGHDPVHEGVGGQLLARHVLEEAGRVAWRRVRAVASHEGRSPGRLLLALSFPLALHLPSFSIFFSLRLLVVQELADIGRGVPLRAARGLRGEGRTGGVLGVMSGAVQPGGLAGELGRLGGGGGQLAEQ